MHLNSVTDYFFFLESISLYYKSLFFMEEVQFYHFSDQFELLFFFLVKFELLFHRCCILQVTYMNVISPLAELDAQQFPLVQSCVFPKMVSTCDDVRKASAEGERRIDAHVLICRYH